MNDPILSAISLCKKAGKLLLGFDVVKEAAEKGTGKLLVMTADLSPKTQKEVVFLAEKYHVPSCTIPQTMDDIQNSVGKRSGVLAICDQGFAGLLRKHLPQADKEEPIL